MANTEVYDGPWTPTKDLVGIIAAEGLVAGEDEVVVSIRDPLEIERDIVLTIQMNSEVNIGHIPKALIQARRTKSSGAEIHVWAC